MLLWTLATLALLSLLIGFWQFLAALRFPLHQRRPVPAQLPPVTLLKPLKGTDSETAACLTSWLTQDYPAPVQILFGVADTADPACNLVRELLARFPHHDAQLVICSASLGANAKVSSLIQLERLARHSIIVVSDADVHVPSDFLAQATQPLAQPQTGLVNCFYRLANPANLAMHWEAVAVNADFWSQVTQSLTLQPMNFALGAVMLTHRHLLHQIGGFPALVNHLADDYQLGNRIARLGNQLALCPLVVECRSGPMTPAEVWSHQLRWARTIRICQPLPYFFSILSNATLWPLLWLTTAALTNPAALAQPLLGTALCLVFRIASARVLLNRLAAPTPDTSPALLAPLKDLLQAIIWTLAFLGNHVTWRGTRYRIQPGGHLIPV